jgi:hypothetical protein
MIFIISPPRVWLDLLSTFVLTRYIYLWFSSEEDPDFVVEDVEYRLRPHPTLPVVLALRKMLLLACYSEPELDPMWVVLWCITIAVLLLIIVCIECTHPRRFVR